MMFGSRAWKFGWRIFGFILSVVSILVGVIGLCNLIIIVSSESRVVDQLEAVPHRKTALILGAGPQSLALRQRLDAGIDLFGAGKVDQILISGGGSGTEVNETRFMYRYLRFMGVPAERILRDDFGFRTLESVRRAKSEFGLSELTVVTQRYHCYRGVFLAQTSGIDVVGYVADDAEREFFPATRSREVFARVVAVGDAFLGSFDDSWRVYDFDP